MSLHAQATTEERDEGKIDKERFAHAAKQINLRFGSVDAYLKDGGIQKTAVFCLFKAVGLYSLVNNPSPKPWSVDRVKFLRDSAKWDKAEEELPIPTNTAREFLRICAEEGYRIFFY